MKICPKCYSRYPNHRTKCNTCDILLDEYKVCETCGAVVENDTKVCPRCNKPFEENGKLCSYCGRKIENDDFEFCPGCGKPFVDNNRFCPFCGKKIENNDFEFCPGCGKSLNVTSESTTEVNYTYNTTPTIDFKEDVKDAIKLVSIIPMFVIIIALISPYFEAIWLWSDDEVLMNLGRIVILCNVMHKILNEEKNMKRDTIFVGFWFTLDAIIEHIRPDYSADFEQGFSIILFACFIIIIEGFIMHDIQKEISLSSCYSSIASGVIVLGAAIIDIMVMGKTFVFVEGLLLSAIVIGIAIKDIIEFHE